MCVWVGGGGGGGLQCVRPTSGLYSAVTKNMSAVLLLESGGEKKGYSVS